MSKTQVEEILRTKFLTREKFVDDIEVLVLNSKLNYIDAILHYCEEAGIELEMVPKLLNRAIKEKLEYDAGELNFLKLESRARLPL
jgi:hypothetical protein